MTAELYVGVLGMTQVELVERVKREYVNKWIGLKDNNVVAISDTHRTGIENCERKA